MWYPPRAISTMPPPSSGIAPAVRTDEVPPLPTCPLLFRPLPIAVPSAATTNMVEAYAPPSGRRIAVSAP